MANNSVSEEEEEEEEVLRLSMSLLSPFEDDMVSIYID